MSAEEITRHILRTRGKKKERLCLSSVQHLLAMAILSRVGAATTTAIIISSAKYNGTQSYSSSSSSREREREREA